MKYMEQMVEKLKRQCNRSSTANKYLDIWRIFNKFVIWLDKKPKTWEERLTLFCAYLVQEKRKSTTIKSYISAIKWVLRNDGYVWNEAKLQLTALTKACKLQNDIVRTCLPISYKLLELVLFEVNRIFGTQWYLRLMYKTLFALSYYGLFRIGEVTLSQHVIQAWHVHLAMNKSKLLIMLYTSKTHGRESHPQQVKITSYQDVNSATYKSITYFCPFKLAEQYIKVRGNFIDADEQFFIFHDGTPVKPLHARRILKKCLQNLGLDYKFYAFTSLRLGRAFDLQKFGYNLLFIKKVGRWQSSAVYRYLKM